MEGTGFKYDFSIFKFQPKNSQIRRFWSQIKEFSFSHKTLLLEKFEGFNFKWDTVFKNGPSKICGRQPLKKLKGYGLRKQNVPLKFFKICLPQILLGPFLNTLSQISQWLIQIPAPKYPKVTVFVLSLSIFIFVPNFAYWENSSIVISKLTIIFSNISPKIPKYDIFGEKSIYFFYVKLCVTLILLN